MLCPGCCTQVLTPGYLSSARGLQPWPTAQHSPPYPASAGRARTRTRTPRLRREKGPIPGSLGAMVSACSHCRTSLQNLPQGNKRREKRFYLLGKSKQFRFSCWAAASISGVLHLKPQGTPRNQRQHRALEHCWPWGSRIVGSRPSR